MKIVTPAELRQRPELVGELRERPQDFVERRWQPATQLEVRADGDGDGWSGGGLAIVYDSRSENLGGFVEIIKPGAARDVLARDPDVRALFNHDANLVLGRTRSGTLALEDGSDGLDYLFDAPRTSYADDLRVLMDRGDVTQSSFAFRVAPDAVEWDEDPDTGLLIRIIHRFSGLYDVSPVTYPAYPSATSGTRAEATDDESADEAPAPERREDDDAARAAAEYARRAARRRLRSKRA